MFNISQHQMHLKIQSAMDKTDSAFKKMSHGISRFWQAIFIDDNHFPAKDKRLTAIYSRERDNLYVCKILCAHSHFKIICSIARFDSTNPDFFCPAVRSRIVQFILDRTLFENTTNKLSVGINPLISMHVYIAAYPLHDVSMKMCVKMRFYVHKLHHLGWSRYDRFKSPPFVPRMGVGSKLLSLPTHWLY